MNSCGTVIVQYTTDIYGRGKATITDHSALLKAGSEMPIIYFAFIRYLRIVGTYCGSASVMYRVW